MRLPLALVVMTVVTASASPPKQSTPTAPVSRTATTKAVQLQIDRVTTASQIGSRAARPGHEFVTVDTSWKNIIPLTPVEKAGRRTMESTPFVVPMLRKQMWLMTDDRFADTVDLEAQAATAGALPPDGFTIAALNDVVRGKIVFEAPAGARYRAFQFYDNDHGHALIPLGGAKPSASAPTIGSPQQNSVLQMAISEAAFAQPGSAPPGQRLFRVSLRGISRSSTDIVDLQFGQYVFAQTDQGCVSQPEAETSGLARPFGEVGSFPPTSPNEGQLAFVVPDGTKAVRVLITPAQAGSIVLPASPNFALAWPAAQQTVADGTTMKLHLLPPPARPAWLPAPGAGREHVVLDLVLENLKQDQGIDFQTTQQLRLIEPNGGFIEPSPLTNQAPCRIGETGIVPAGHARRFTLVYDVPAGSPRKLQYRGFERDEVVLEIRK